MLSICLLSLVHLLMHHGIKEPYKRLIFQHSMHHWLKYGRDIETTSDSEASQAGDDRYGRL